MILDVVSMKLLCAQKVALNGSLGAFGGAIVAL